MLMSKMTWPEVDQYLGSCEIPTVLIPISPVEEHGLHLPLGTDFLLTERATIMVAERLSCLVFPTIPLMCCGISRKTSGTYPIEGETLKGITRDLVLELARKGFRRIFFLSAHFGFSVEVMRESIQKIASNLNSQDCIAAVIPLKDVMQLTAGLVETAGDSHAGEIETSVALTLFPDLVRTPLPLADFHRMTDGQPTTLSQSGVHGDPQKATPEKGKLIVQAAVKGVLAKIASY